MRRILQPTGKLATRGRPPPRAAVTGPWPTVVWWNLARESIAISYPWSRRELDALRASGVHLPEIDDIVRRRSREWLRPLCNAAEQLVLVVHHDERGTHPLVDTHREPVRRVGDGRNRAGVA